METRTHPLAEGNLYTALEQARTALERGTDDEVAHALAALGFDGAPTLRQLDRLESMRHGTGSGPARRSTLSAALDRAVRAVERDRMAAAPEIDLSPWSPKLETMDRICAEIGVDFEQLSDFLADLHRVNDLDHIGNRGIPRASVGGHFDCDFGRDSIQIARDLGHEFPDLFRAVVVRLASLQGQPASTRLQRVHPLLGAKMASQGHGALNGDATRLAMVDLIDTLMTRFRREEEGGRILHENRDDARGSDLEAGGWGFPYYGATDSSPGFIQSAWRFLSLYPQSSLLELPMSLNEKVDPNRTPVTVRESILKATRWIVGRLEDPRGGGFLWNQKMLGHRGIENQVWMDSGNSAFHSAPYLPVEVQGQAYDALIAAAEMLEQNPGPKGQRTSDSLSVARELRTRAAELRDRFFRDFAIHHDGRFETFAHTIQIAEDGQVQRSSWIKSNAGRLLDSRLFDTDDPEILKMRDGLIDRLFAPDMVGPFGLIRTMSNQAERYDPLAYHNGSIWPTDNMAIAHGVLRQANNTRDAAERREAAGDVEGARALFAKADDFQAKAESLMTGILTACADAKTQGFPAPEWIPGDAGMRIPPKEVIEEGPDGQKRVIELTPMKIQGWTVSAMWAAASYLSDRALKAERPGYLTPVELAMQRGGVPRPNTAPAQ